MASFVRFATQGASPSNHGLKIGFVLPVSEGQHAASMHLFSVEVATSEKHFPKNRRARRHLLLVRRDTTSGMTRRHESQTALSPDFHGLY
jgi:hypothetical protein